MKPAVELDLQAIGDEAGPAARPSRREVSTYRTRLLVGASEDLDDQTIEQLARERVALDCVDLRKQRQRTVILVAAFLVEVEPAEPGREFEVVFVVD